MTQEEAFKRLEQMYDFYAHAMDANKNYPLKGDAEAIKVALLVMAQDRSAHITREQVEKMRGEWQWQGPCRDNQGRSWATCSVCGARQRLGDYGAFCPACGSPMIDKAVDILWKRLEEIE